MGSRFRQRTRSAAIVSFSLQLTPLACRSSLNVDLQVFLGRPLFLLPSAGVHSIARRAGRSGAIRMTCLNLKFVLLRFLGDLNLGFLKPIFTYSPALSSLSSLSNAPITNTSPLTDTKTFVRTSLTTHALCRHYILLPADGYFLIHKTSDIANWQTL